MAEVAKKKNSCHNCWSTDHYASKFSKKKKKIYAIEKVQEEEIQEKDSESYSIGDSFGESSDYDQDPLEKYLVVYQEETQPEIQEEQLEEGLPHESANKYLCKQTQGAQSFLVKPTKEWNTFM
ncbi:hypothetical protein O181_073016 [Austropuccinia psidii MF-1]|uniref:Uncharacterized protein n=1 Tax=Austropuccinia psidii MF-1 TaxID=1389203 RepID=A0A9Q3FAB0_9BASI|nr:hypothetical protein [Austropuccinia psidii MF-1]